MTAAATITTTLGGLLGRESASATPLGDEELIAQARDGDHEAFRQLVERHEGRVYALALRILRDPVWAQDAAQEAFIKAYRALRRFEGRSTFGTWMYRLTYNHCLDMKRADKSGRLVEWDEERMSSNAGPTGGAQLDEEPQVRPGALPGPGDALERSELRSQLAEAIATLPEDARQTLILREVDGLSYAEIAATLQVPKGTIMSRLFHARRKLREVLRERGVTPAGSGPPAEEEGKGR